MNFWFCETCGKRLTEADLAEGQARDKKLKGVFCKECAVGVMTMEVMPLSKDEARKILSETGQSSSKRMPSGQQANSGNRVDTSTPAHLRTHLAGHSATGKKPVETPATHSTALVVVGVSVGLVLMAILLSGGSDAPRPANSAADRMPARPLPVPQPGKAANADPPRTPAPERAIEPASARSGKPESVELANALEEQARGAFAHLEKSEGLAADDGAGRKLALEGFLKVHGNTKFAARAREALDALKAEAPAIAAPVAPAILVAPVAPAPVVPPRQVAPSAPPAGTTTARAEKPPEKRVLVDESAQAAAAYTLFNDEFMALMLKREGMGAQSLLSRAEKDPALKLQAAQLQRDHKLIEWQGDIERGVLRGLEKLKERDHFELAQITGERVRVGRRAEFQVLEVKEESLVIGSKAMSITLPMSKLSLETRAVLAELGLGEDAASGLSRALNVLLSFQSDGAKAAEIVKSALERARSAGAAAEDVELLQSKIEACARATKEALATAELARFDLLFAAKSWVEAERSGAKLLSEFAACIVVRKRAELRDLQFAAAHKGAPITEYSLTLQQGLPVKEAHLDSYLGTRCGHVYRYREEASKVRPCTTVMQIGNARSMIGLVSFAVFAREGGPLPDDAEIQDARFRVYRFTENSMISLRKILKPWKPEEITYNTLSADEKFFATQGFLKGGIGSQVDGWYEFDCTEAVKGAQQEGKNYGWAVEAATETWKTWTSLSVASAGYEKDPSLRPKLVLKVRCARFPDPIPGQKSGR